MLISVSITRRGWWGIEPVLTINEAPESIPNSHHFGAGETAEWVKKVLAIKTHDSSSIPGIHMVDRMNSCRLFSDHTGTMAPQSFIHSFIYSYSYSL